MCKFRDLRADEIECRVQSVKKNGIVLLLYKDARVDMNILDETVGSSNWQREHYECKGNLFCRVGINIASTIDMSGSEGVAYISEHWVWKSDCGTESNTEAQKGEASDSFKRACFNWGIGRELYTAPFIWVSMDKCNIENGKCYDKFVVDKIVIENKQITGLSVKNTTKKCNAFSMGVKDNTKWDVGHEATPAVEVITCADCGKVVDPTMAQRTENAFGVKLCKECGIKRANANT